MAADLSLARKLSRVWQAGGRQQKDAHGLYPSTNSLSPYWYMPSGYVDTSGVGDGTGNSAAQACFNVLGGSFAEAPTAVYGLDDDGSETLQLLHPAAALVHNPNPYMVGELLWGYTIVATHAAGDAYWFKVRSAGGRVVELWPLMPDLVDPRDGTGSRATAEEQALHQVGQGPFIAYYEYRAGGGTKRIESADIVHLRLALDPDNPRKGKAPLKTALREVVSDEEAGQFAASMLRNMGVPGVVLTPSDPDDTGPDAKEAEAIADTWENRFGGQNRGRPLVMEGGAMKVNVVSFSPQQMDYSSLRRVPEERVSAVLGVPAILAGLGAGLERATYSNAQALRDFFTESKLAPLWRLYGAQLTQQLLPDFTDVAGTRMGFDLTVVRALQEDADKTNTTWLAALVAGGITVSEYKTKVGLQVQPGDDVYLRGVGLVEVPSDEAQRMAAVAEAERILAEQAS